MNSHDRRTRPCARPVALAAAFTLFLALPALAQTTPPPGTVEVHLEPWEQVLRSEIETAHTAMAALEAERAGPPVTRMVADGESASLTMTFGRGQYWITAVCDLDCSDVDLAVVDEAGGVVDSDYEIDDFPVVGFTVDASATYEVRVIMASCSVDPCGVGVQTYVGGP